MPSVSAKPSQDFLPIKEIRDGVVVLKDNSMRMVLIASSLNFALKSQDEQTALLFQYQNFLNSLDFQVQIFTQSRKLDIRPYINILEDRMKEQANDLIKIQTKEYVEFIKSFTDATNIMSKSFFIVVPYSPPVYLNRSGFLSKLFRKKQGDAEELKSFEENKTQLEQRGSVVEQGLSPLGIRIVALGTEELVELYYKLFNPGERDVPTLDTQAYGTLR